MKTLIGLEIELVRSDWQESGISWSPDTRESWQGGGCCRCRGEVCKSHIPQASVGLELPEGWKVEGDCSIPPPPYGIEVVSPKILLDQMQQDLPVVCAHLLLAGYIAGPSEWSGIHISVDYQSTTLGINMADRFHSWEKEGIIPGSLSEGPLSRIKDPSTRPQFTHLKAGRGKSFMVNLDQRKGRIEFRHLASSTDSEAIIREVIKTLRTR